MRVAFLCLLLAVVLLADAKKSFSTRRKSGGNNRRGQTHKHPPPPQPATPHRTDTGSSSTFLNSERGVSGGSGGSSGAGTNTHYRGNPFDNAKQHQPSAPQPGPQGNAPIGFERVQSQSGQKLGFDKVNSDVQKAAGGQVPSAPGYPGKPSAPNGPPPAYPGYGSPGTHGGYDAPPAYPGRPINAPPVYSASNPSYPQRAQGYPQQNSPYPQQQWSQPGQQNMGYPGQGHSYGNYPNQGYQQGYGSYSNTGGYGGYGNNHMGGGYGQQYPGYSGNSFGGSPFGNSNPYGGSPFSSGMGGFGGFGGGNSFGGYGNNHYSPNNFGYSSKPGLFGSLFGGHSSSPYGYHKRSRFGGLPIPIPIPIPIPLGGFGLFGGRSHNHRVLDTFIKNQTINDSDNSTAVYILNNATFTPCTTDQFIYDSLNVTIMSCTADNCTAIKVFTTTSVSGETTVRSAGITMCMEHNTTYSSFADNVNPTVRDLHKYLMRVCKEVVVTDTTGTVAEETGRNVSVKITRTMLDEKVVKEGGETVDISEKTSPTQQPVESSTVRTLLDSTSGSSNSSDCEVFDCSSIEMCLPTVEIVDRCDTPDCPFTRTGYRPCVTIKMCKSPTTPVTTFATLNNTLSRIDQYNNVTSVNDVANLTLISYIPPVPPPNCSVNASDPACSPQVSVPPGPVPSEDSSAVLPESSSSSSVSPSFVPAAGTLLGCGPDGSTSTPTGEFPCPPPHVTNTFTVDEMTSPPAMM